MRGDRSRDPVNPLNGTRPPSRAGRVQFADDPPPGSKRFSACKRTLRAETRWSPNAGNTDERGAGMAVLRLIGETDAGEALAKADAMTSARHARLKSTPRSIRCARSGARESPDTKSPAQLIVRRARLEWRSPWPPSAPRLENRAPTQHGENVIKRCGRAMGHTRP